MADRNLNFDPTVTKVTPELPDTVLPTAAVDLTDTIATQSASMKALNATAQTALAFRQLDSQFRQDAAGNPNDPQALADLQSKRAQVVSAMGQQVPAIASRDYMTHTIQLQESSDKMNELWGMHQQVRNAKSDLDTAEKTQLDMANAAGQQFGDDGANMGNLSSVLNFETAQGAIKQFVAPVIGAPRTDDYLKSFSANWVKSFVAGLAEKNPQAAAAMLEQPNIAEHFTTQDKGDMVDVIKKTERQQQLIQTLQTTKNDGGLADIINDPNSSYYDKRAAIDKMDAAGSVSPKAASAARRVIKSTMDADAQTDTPVMSDIVNKTYDLNANANSSADDYLNGVQNLHQRILEAQAQGQLTAPDATKLTKQVNELTSKKLADATNTAGMEQYDANKQFDVLPPEYRGQATRALFYAGSGQNWTPQQFKSQATQIIDQINQKRRAAALQTVNGIPQQDTDFLKTVPNATPDAIAATAKKYGISNQQVILQLRADAAAKARATKNGVKRIAPGGSESENEDEPAKAVTLTRTPDTENEDDAAVLQ